LFLISSQLQSQIIGPDGGRNVGDILDSYISTFNISIEAFQD